MMLALIVIVVIIVGAVFYMRSRNANSDVWIALREGEEEKALKKGQFQAENAKILGT